MKRVITIYADEHVHDGTLNGFRFMGFRVVKISKTKKFAGRDEHDYIHEISAENAIFLTADRAFVNDALENNVKHSGILLMPSGWEINTLDIAAAGLAGLIRAEIERNGSSFIKNKIYYIDGDGYHLVDKNDDKLIYSADKVALDFEEYETKNS